MDLKSAIFNIKNENEFFNLTLQVFKFQFEYNPLYRSFCDLLYTTPSDVKDLKDIPFLPIGFFKSHKVLSSHCTEQIVFLSSGTTGQTTSKHFVSDLELYETSFFKGFQNFYGPVEDYVVLGLLPSYLEREGSSLVYMVDQLIKTSTHAESGFYLDDLDALAKTIISLENQQKKTILIGVSFALLNLIEKHLFQLKYTIVMETGGMKGKRKEMIRKELHHLLKKGFGVQDIHSEYGMTELLSQAYSTGQGVFKTPPWMKVLTRESNDELTIQKAGKSGGVNIIDLANLNSCSFIATQDLGKVYNDGSFEIIGRFDQSDIRGCNLMVL